MKAMHTLARWCLCLLLCVAWARADAAEQRVALVIGNAAYRHDPLDNPVHDARLVAAALQQAGFDVTRAENLDRNGLLGALRTFGARLNDETVAVLYYAGHGLQLRDRNYLIPTDAEIRSEDEIALAGIDLSFILGRMSAARSRVNIVVLDACRNNPFAQAGKVTTALQGLAPMDAPVGTLLAYATAPGKLAADALGGPNEKNGLYAQQLARHLLTPGLPVEHVFKRVREAVVRASRQAQVPWESSSLQGEFAFIPSASPERVAALRSDAPAPPALPVAASRTGLPRVGDHWRYRVRDQFRLGDVFVTARVEEVSEQGIAELRTVSTEARPHGARVALAPVFVGRGGGDSSPAPMEFAPYLQAAGALDERALRGVELMQSVEQSQVPLRASVEGDEDIETEAGRFRARKLVLRGQAQARGAARSAVATEHRLWYAADAKRVVKHEITTTVGGALRQQTTVELVEYLVR
jgi:hypothetical protein